MVAVLNNAKKAVITIAVFGMREKNGKEKKIVFPRQFFWFPRAKMVCYIPKTPFPFPTLFVHFLFYSNFPNSV